ncbi:MAG TPA: serine/threonine-protein kinase, partial [Planctomycetota bacterium]|nr:serine/threonine-protein kinase [Planctomycetota bacterium]
MPPSTPSTVAVAGTSSTFGVLTGEQPCLRCGALLDVARFAPGVKVRCGGCRAINITGEIPQPRERHSSPRLSTGDEEPLDRIFSGVSGAALPALEDAGPASDTVDIRTLQQMEKFQPALATLSPTGTPVVTGLGGGTPGGPSSRWSDQLEECQLGAYKILRRIATGGMGTVYEADHIALHRKVAVKILHRDIAGAPEIQERLNREALTLARIRHAHIVEIFDIGNFEGRPFLVMEFIAGGDLKSLLTARAMEEREALRIGAEIAEAVDYAHQRGIIHRDLKPANILLDEAQSVHVADFGLAKVVGSSTQLTATGTTVGTPAYMAPEQARGQVDQLDARADVYSIGAILYEMLTGRP